MQDQTRPLKPVSRSCTVRTERISGIFNEHLRTSNPVFIEVLRQAPTKASTKIGNKTHHFARTIQPTSLPRRIEGSKIRLDRVHIRVQTSIFFALAPVAVPRVRDAPIRRFPPVRVLIGKRFIKQRPASFMPSKIGCGSRKNHERVRIGFLADRLNRASLLPRRIQSGEPPAIFIVMQRSGQRIKPVLDKTRHSLDTTHLSKCKHVRHSTRNPQLNALGLCNGTISIQITEASRAR